MLGQGPLRVVPGQTVVSQTIGSESTQAVYKIGLARNSYSEPCHLFQGLLRRQDADMM